MEITQRNGIHERNVRCWLFNKFASTNRANRAQCANPRKRIFSTRASHVSHIYMTLDENLKCIVN